MIVTCDGCQTKYLLGDDRVPERGIRVRCPKCRYVWRLTPAPVESLLEVRSGAYSSEISIDEPARGGWVSMEQPRMAVPGETAVQPVQEETEIPEDKPVAEHKVTEDPESRKKKERARRLARVFASDLLEYNREKRDQGLERGDLMAVLGPEIKKAWEAYKQKVGPELVESSNYFRDALNEIVADGQNVF
jgi:predicted Zn finger-like uncharacterized protein